MGKGPEQHFKENIQRVQRHMKRCSASLAIREIQMKTTMRYHFTPVRMTIINKSTNKSAIRKTIPVLHIVPLDGFTHLLGDDFFGSLSLGAHHHHGFWGPISTYLASD